MTEKTTVDSQAFEILVQKIINCNNLDDLAEIGKEMVVYEMNGYKRALVTMYKTRRGEIVRDLINQNGIFSNLYFLIKGSDENTLKQVGKLLYNLKDKNVLSKGEINYLFEVYEKKKNGTTRQDKETEEEIA